MRTLKYFTEEILYPLCEEAVEVASEITKTVLGILLWVVLFITVPIWLLPYELIKAKKNKDSCTEPEEIAEL